MWRALRVVEDNRRIQGAIEMAPWLLSLMDPTCGNCCPNCALQRLFLSIFSKVSVRIMRLLAKASRGVNSYRGELLGLMIIRLFLLAVNKLWQIV
jgi:hypothetical protein